MAAPKPADVSVALKKLSGGGTDALDELLPLVYQELRRMAAAELRRGGGATTLQPTVLVHEAYLKLLGGIDLGFGGRAHFFGAAARAMRQIVVDHYRARKAHKRGGNEERVTLDSQVAPAGVASAEEVLAVDQAFAKLEAAYPRHAEVVLLSYFGGLSHQEIAELRGTSVRTVEREWRFARAWLHDAMTPVEGGIRSPAVGVQLAGEGDREPA